MLPTIVRRKRYTSPGIFNDLFSDSYLPRFFSWEDHNGAGCPAVNVEETDKEYRIEVSAPGYNKDELKVSVEDGVLSISSEIKTEGNDENENYIRREFASRPFRRSFTLPEEVNSEKISAKHQNGVLHVYLPKAEVKVNPSKEIKIG